MHRLSFSEFKKLSSKGNVIPVYASFLADLLTPVSAFLRLQTISKRAFLLESVEGGEKTARYSFLGCQPFSTIIYDNHTLQEQNGTNTKSFNDNVFEFLKRRFAKFEAVRPAGLPRFTGGAVGYFGYETIGLIEDVPQSKPDEPDLPQALLMLFETVLAFDHLTHQIYIITNVFLEDFTTSLNVQYERALKKIESIKSILERETSYVAEASTNNATISSNFTKAGFCQAVIAAKEYIEAGDIFQVVLSQKFQRTIKVNPFDIYRALRVINPSPYLYFLQFDDHCIIGSSPELLVRVEDGRVEVRPIAGTRPRGGDEKEETRLMDDLRRNEKEVAEHVMLVDLGRNDVGRVSQFGSVKVTDFMEVEKYSHVMHLVSNVCGNLRPELSALDALQACFPAGTVSGAPKIRAMEIISELEPTSRGVYAGALGYLDFSGNLDTCIAIRTLVIQNSQAYFQAGAGIVADSIPEREFQETVDKAAALRAAMDLAERGLQ
ncbi:anthranilate synthase component I [candidate division KSB1 bacterium]|nr:anthranilate synthase component I [candidate division KSB1 bacterium]NIR68949.1 anthranilate synthase component I [candidate division KSB1 bacterium]NIS27286.1 anthranilate synthase component I [candidate division KSB1 bacterium]NIT74165.1 anthranilate synthase component I [candidate division KSB1 bacterium]NIU28016.1 anthranilate synthase component I [candidate division KSB1 bacterium]